MSFLSFIKSLFKSREYIFRTPIEPDSCEDILKCQLSNKKYWWLRGYTWPQGFCLWVRTGGRNSFYREFKAGYYIDSDSATIIKGCFILNSFVKIFLLIYNAFLVPISLVLYGITVNDIIQHTPFDPMTPVIPLIFLVGQMVMLTI